MSRKILGRLERIACDVSDMKQIVVLLAEMEQRRPDVFARLRPMLLEALADATAPRDDTRDVEIKILKWVLGVGVGVPQTTDAIFARLEALESKSFTDVDVVAANTETTT
jgi:hypothetical protein